MAYTRAWSELAPAGSDLAKNAPLDMQHIRTDIKERLMTPFQIDDFTTDPIKVNYIRLGYATSTKGGHVRLTDDTGTYRWLAGLQANAAAVDYVIQDSVASLVRLRISASTGLVIAGYGLTISTVGLTVSAGGANITGGLTVAGGGTISGAITFPNTVTFATSVLFQSTLSILNDTNKALSGNSTDFTIINDNALGNIKLRTNGVVRLIVDQNGSATFNNSIHGLGTLTIDSTSTFGSTITVSANGINVTGASTFNSQLTVVGTAGFSSLVTFNGGYTVPSGTSATFGTSAATVGFIRMPNAAAIVWRNAANSANVNVIYLDNADNVQIGTDLNVAGALTWTGTASGNGSSITNLNASSIASGTVPTARVVGAYGNITGVGTLTALTVSGAVTIGGITTFNNNIAFNGASNVFANAVEIDTSIVITNNAQLLIGSGSATAAPVSFVKRASAPTSLADGYLWYDNTGFFFRKGTTSIQLA